VSGWFLYKEHSRRSAPAEWQLFHGLWPPTWCIQAGGQRITATRLEPSGGGIYPRKKPLT